MVHLSRWKVILLAVTLALGLLFSYANALSPAQRERWFLQVQRFRHGKRWLAWRFRAGCRSRP